MPTSGRDNIIGKLKREPVANVTPDAVIGKVNYWKALFRFGRRTCACRRRTIGIRIPSAPIFSGCVRCVLITKVAVLLQSLVEDAFEIGQQFGI